jgi:hypothetical protein
VNAGEVTAPPTTGYATGAGANTGSAVHVASFGPNSVNVTVAPGCGFTRPLTIAVSVSVPDPTVTAGDAIVAIDGCDFVTTDV